MKTKTKLIVAGAALVLVGGYFAQRQAKAATVAAANAVNPLNNDNIFYTAANKVTNILRGKAADDQGDSLGTWIAGKFGY